MLVSIVTLLKTQLTVSCLLCLSLASLASTYSLISLCRSFENLVRNHSAVSGDCTAVIYSGFVYFSVCQMEMSAATGGLGMSGHPQRPGTVKSRRWGGLRQQWKLLGLFEIDPQHEFYSLTCMMKEGLAAAIQNTMDNAPTVSTGQQRQHFNHLTSCT